MHDLHDEEEPAVFSEATKVARIHLFPGNSLFRRWSLWTLRPIVVVPVLAGNEGEQSSFCLVFGIRDDPFSFFDHYWKGCFAHPRREVERTPLVSV